MLSFFIVTLIAIAMFTYTVFQTHTALTEQMREMPEGLMTTADIFARQVDGDTVDAIRGLK